jgi:flagellar protein FlaG
MSSITSVGYTPVSPKPVPDSREQPAKQETQAKPQVSQVQNQIVDLERIGQAFNKKLRFVVDHNSNNVIVKVIDKETDKVIKEIPPEELQRLYRNLSEAIGLLFNEMV